MSNCIKRVIVCIVSVVLFACSTKQDLTYLKSHNGKKLVVNPPLTRRYIDDTFVLPHVGKVKPQSIKPPTLNS